jgi:hypothetical protein
MKKTLSLDLRTTPLAKKVGKGPEGDSRRGCADGYGIFQLRLLLPIQVYLACFSHPVFDLSSLSLLHHSSGTTLE